MAKETHKPTPKETTTQKPVETQKPLRDTTILTERSSKVTIVTKTQ